MAQVTMALDLNAAALKKITAHSRYEKALRPGRRKAHGKIGAFMRTKARSLIGSRVGPKAKPRGAGQPYRARQGSRGDIKQIIFLADEHGLTLGPVAYNSGETTPDRLEDGGDASVTMTELDGREVVVRALSPADFQRAKRHRRYKRRVRIPAHPVYGPTLDAELNNPRLMNAWENILGPLPKT